MGQNLALNIADNAGCTVSCYNRPDEFAPRLWGALERAVEEGGRKRTKLALHAYTELEVRALAG
eukprot:scaffold2555_cov282-Prasinococcus_capsulatus_cf.AAC.3